MANAIQQMLREVMDIRQASEYLGISGDTLYRYASEGFIPAFKLGNRWRFKRSLLDAWMVEKSRLGSSRALEADAGVAVMPKQKKPVRRAR
jgi:excisionase family DNA binding protein